MILRFKPHKYDTTFQMYNYQTQNTETKLFENTETFILQPLFKTSKNYTLKNYYLSNTWSIYRLKTVSRTYLDIPLWHSWNALCFSTNALSMWIMIFLIELHRLLHWIILELDSFLMNQIRGQNRFVVELGQCVPWIQ